MDPSRTLAARATWIIMVLFGIGLAIYQIQDRISYYAGHPTTTNINVNEVDILRFPQVTICNENEVVRTAADKLGK